MTEPKSKWNSRKLAGYVLALAVLVALAKLGAPGEAYTALGLIGAAFLAGQSAVDAMERRG